MYNQKLGKWCPKRERIIIYIYIYMVLYCMILYCGIFHCIVLHDTMIVRMFTKYITYCILHHTSSILYSLRSLSFFHIFCMNDSNLLHASGLWSFAGMHPWPFCSDPSLDVKTAMHQLGLLIWWISSINSMTLTRSQFKSISGSQGDEHLAFSVTNGLRQRVGAFAKRLALHPAGQRPKWKFETKFPAWPGW